MAKNIRWQIPFVSIQGVHYRVDIYDEGTFTPVELTAGPTPFVTDEDNSDDFFHPVRSQSGTLQVCTLKPDGTYITLDELLPSNNIARPVKLWRILGGGAAGVFEWQGFLSCEAYSQDYTSIPQILQLPVISVLEAMDSVFLDTTLVTGMQQVREQIYYAMTELDRQCGMSQAFFSTIYYSRTSSNFMTRLLDATILYDIHENTNEETVSLVVRGVSCKQALERICRYMGWILRENSWKVYFQRINEEWKMYEQTLSNFGGPDSSFPTTRTEVSLTRTNISELIWMGTSHKLSVEQGAKSVEVVANLEQYDLKLGLPDFPTENLFHSNQGVIEAYVTMDHDFNNALTFNYYEVTVRETSGGYDVIENDESDVESAFNDCILSPNCDRTEQYKSKENGTAYVLTKNVGAFFGRFSLGGEWKDGLYIVAANEMNSPDNAPTVFKMDSIISYRLVDGTLKLRATGITIDNNGTSITDFRRQVKMKLRFGDVYWNGSGWQPTETYFTADFSTHINQDQDPGAYWLDIPITSQLAGSISIEVCGSINGGTQYSGYFRPFYDLLLTELSLEYEEPEYITKSDRSENKYYRLLGTNFRDDISVSTELASDLNNRPSPSLVMDNVTTPMQYLSYIYPDGTTYTMRPEVELLNRLAAYYGAARQRLELEVAHPTAAPLPLLKLKGINDGKVYLPLAESRDWQTGVCKLQCFELPQ